MSTARQTYALPLCQFNRLHQAFPGRRRLCKFLERQSHHLRALPPIAAKVAAGTYLQLDPKKKFDGPKTLLYGLNPREPLSNIALEMLRHGDHALDIGANVGYFSALASVAVGAQEEVYAFKASPATYERLQTLVRGK